METYESLKDFVDALPPPEEELTEVTRPVMQTGLVDRAQSDEQKIRFAPSIQCSNWIEVPESIIEKVDYLGNQRCGQDTYPRVRLHLKSPGTDEGDAIFQALAAILQQPGTAPGPMMPAPTMAVPPQSVPPQSVPPQSVPPQSVPPQSAPTMAPGSRSVAPTGPYAAPTRGHVTPAPARRHASAPPRPGPNTPGPVSGCGG